MFKTIDIGTEPTNCFKLSTGYAIFKNPSNVIKISTLPDQKTTTSMQPHTSFDIT